MNKKLYRLSNEGMVGGVCAGIAQFLGVSVSLIRIIAVIFLFMGFFVITMVVYFILVFLLDDKPIEAIQQQGKKPFKSRIEELNAQFSQSQQRVNNLEKYIISTNYEIDKKFKDLK
ncbi:envelope stress response membrane protein PspC [Thorsellia kenyensis]|uniref:Envelope stress response membrane protein PspC n=1 Tax=Thorsellia kenyensis TaxID=1549888 RepID=A0ABV6C777_9GAMM